LTLPGVVGFQADPLKERNMDKTEEVARALCSATGKNPDEMQIDRPQQIPQWHLYDAEARKFIAAYNVMARAGSSRASRE
jgi:hypothetical protein